MKKTIKFIDLFAGLGGVRLGLEQACAESGYLSECVLTSEIKKHAVNTLKHNFKNDNIVGDIFNIKNEDIPDFDVLLGGFPCQPFSAGGKRQGFADTRGTLFFEIERILKYKQPKAFILENVEGLVKHDLESKTDSIGRTLKTILYKLETELGYHVAWRVIDSINFGVPQSRKRIYIVGSKTGLASLDDFEPKKSILSDVLEKGKETINTDFVHKLLSHFKIEELYGKSIKDKRGGENNIHSWDIALKGECTKDQIKLLNCLFKERRKKQWAEEIGIDWMDGMPLTESQISTFFPSNDLFSSSDIDLGGLLNDLVDKGYLRYEYPKKLVEISDGANVISKRVYDETKPKGYNIVTGKLSFEINKILDPNEIAPTLVATDMDKIVVPDGKGLRKFTIREGLRLFGYPESYEIVENNRNAFDLLGNTVVVPVIKQVALRLLSVLK